MKNVSLNYMGKEVFRNLNFQMESGEIVCVETGVLDGGSSLLKLIGGLIEPSNGTIEVDGKVRTAMTDSERFESACIGFEEGGLLSIFSNYNNIAFPMLYNTKLKESLIKERIEDLAEKIGLSEQLYLEPHQLNDVQTRLMNCLRGLCFRPKLLLLDEVQSGMSDDMIERMLRCIKEEQALHSFGVIMTVTSGDKTDFATRKLSINNGRLENVQ